MATKNPMYVDKVVLKNGGVIETESGTDIVSVSSSGTPAVNAPVSTTNATFTGDTTLGDSSADTVTVNATMSVPTPALLSGTPQTLTGAGAVNVTTNITYLVTTGANALTLADGTQGQQKFIVMKTDGGAGTLTPTHPAGFATLTFDDVGDSAHLLFANSAWHFMGGTATVA